MVVTKKEIEETLDRNWIPDRVQLRCTVCDEILYDVPHRNNPSIHEQSFIAAEIDMYTRKHLEDTNHDDYILNILKSNSLEGIDVTMVVNEQ